MENIHSDFLVFEAIDQLKAQLQQKICAALEAKQEWAAIEARSADFLHKIKPRIRLNVGGKLFTTSKTTLVRFPVSVFSVMLSTPHWSPDDGVYFFDRNSSMMDYVLDYAANGFVRIEPLTPLELKQLEDDLEFYHLPYILEKSKNGSDPLPSF